MGTRIRGVVAGRSAAAEEIKAVKTNEMPAANGAGGKQATTESTPQVSAIGSADKIGEYRERRKKEITDTTFSTNNENRSFSTSNGEKKRTYKAGANKEESSKKERSGAGTNKAKTGMAGANNAGTGKAETNNTETENVEAVKEIAFFSEPKRVKKKTQRSIFLFQILFCSLVCFVMLFSKLAVPPLYENLHIYLMRLFGW